MREFAILPHRPEAIEEWAGALRQRFAGRPVAVSLELAKGPLVYALPEAVRAVGVIEALAQVLALQGTEMRKLLSALV